MNKVTFILVFGFSLIAGCDAEHNLKEKTSSLYDLNEDGIDDITYESTIDGYYEFVDRNFDGKVDESHHYGNDDKIIKSKIDENFDGYLETEIFYEKGSPCFSSVDSNIDELRDIFFLYRSGTLIKGSKYYIDSEGKQAIRTVEFKFGFPSKEPVVKTNLSRKQFDEKYLTSMPCKPLTQ